MDDKKVIKKISDEIDFILEIFYIEPDITERLEKIIIKKCLEIKLLLNNCGFRSDDELEDTANDVFENNPKSAEVFDVVETILYNYGNQLDKIDEDFGPPPPLTMKDHFYIEDELKKVRKILKKK